MIGACGVLGMSLCLGYQAMVGQLVKSAFLHSLVGGTYTYIHTVPRTREAENINFQKKKSVMDTIEKEEGGGNDLMKIILLFPPPSSFYWIITTFVQGIVRQIRPSMPTT
jgi:hypothetical protein